MDYLEILVGLGIGLYIGVFIGAKLKKWFGQSTTEKFNEIWENSNERREMLETQSRSNSYVEITALISNKDRPWDKVKIRRDSIVLIDMYDETLKANINGETIEFKLEHECFRRLYYGS